MSLDFGKKDEGSERIKITYHTPHGDFNTIKEATDSLCGYYTEYEVLMLCRNGGGSFSQTVEGIPPLNVEALVRRYGSNRVSTSSLESAKKAFVKGYTSDLDELKSLLNKGLDIGKEV